jgi:hypothetical protein
MRDFEIIQKNNYIDIDLRNTTNSNKAAIINILLEESRVPIGKTQPTLERGGSIKDNINNTTGLRYGSLIWYFLRIYNGQEATKYIAAEIEKKMKFLKSQKIIDSWNKDSLQILWSNRLLTIKFSYYANNEQHKFDTSI